MMMFWRALATRSIRVSRPSSGRITALRANRKRAVGREKRANIIP